MPSVAQRLAVDADGVAGLAVVEQLAVVEHRGAVAQLAHEVGGVGDEEDRAALGLEPLHAVHALALERLVADRQHLVDEHDVGRHVDGDGEGEPGEHARRVVLDLEVDELGDLGEVDDLVEDGVDLGGGEAEDRAVQVDVLAAGEVGVEAGAELEQGGDAAPGADRAARRAHRAGDALEQRRLAAAVVAEEADGLALRHVEGDALQRPELLARVAPGADDALLQRAATSRCRA